ncbi:MAG: fructose,6-bisphosphatase [Acidobacteriota bacterium]|jgi:fructose-1,6-bisphosphatase-3|nr:fructose,6-bisphosphatase [Acidobacteriota bacterium]
MTAQLDPSELTLLQALAARYPTADLALAEVAALRASLSLPKGVVHVVSDVHGEYKKLRHIINNASGSLRPLVETLFDGEMSAEEVWQLLAVVYYPHEAIEYWRPTLQDQSARRVWVRATLRRQFRIVRALVSSRRLGDLRELFPVERRELFEELLFEPLTGRGTFFVDDMIETLSLHERDFSAVRAASRLVRDLSVAEIIVAGDLGDRGPRIDRVIDYLLQQPHVSFAWGNHDASWMGACLGHTALIATVLRISLRYRRLSQLEEGYGVMIAPLERLARTVYADDPADCFKAKGTGLREDLLMARMQKAAAIMQFKLEGQTIRRHPEWELEQRNLLHRINQTEGTVEIEGRAHKMLDTHLPTLDPADPYKLSVEEQACMDRIRQSFVSSSRLWHHMLAVVRHGAMWLRRDQALIFHGCVPVDEEGQPLTLEVDGHACSGRELFDSLDRMVRGCFRRGAERADSDTDWLWYLWSGPRSPLFGKDRMATFETYFVEDKSTHKETKNPYFQLIQNADFCKRLASDFGVVEEALIVNGHVPVRIEKGEAPVKHGGGAVTIDGAFSEAYGDRGYTLILAPERIALAEHHHFESISDAITEGADIVPRVTTVRAYDPPRRVADTEEGERLRASISALEKLADAYEQGLLLEDSGPPH